MSLSDVFKRATAWLKSDRDYWKAQAEGANTRAAQQSGWLAAAAEREDALTKQLAAALAERRVFGVQAPPALPPFSPVQVHGTTIASQMNALDQQAGNDGYLRLNLKQPEGVLWRIMDSDYVLPRTEADLRALVAWAHSYSGWVRKVYGRPEGYKEDERDCEDYCYDLIAVLRSVTAINSVGLMVNAAHAYLLALTAQDGAFVIEAITGEVIRWEDKDFKSAYRMLSGLLLL